MLFSLADKDLETFDSFIPELHRVNDQTFADIALRVFRSQAVNNPLYQEYISNLRVNPETVNSLEAIPYLPISFFKSHAIKTGNWVPETTFLSSSTTGQGQSKHLVADTLFYLHHARRCFEFFFGDVTNYNFLALMPSYIERSGSSLIYMIQHFIDQSGTKTSGFFLNDYRKLMEYLERLKGSSKKTILWGVSFALLDLAEKFELDLRDVLIFETGGMKGRRKEITRYELHSILRQRLNAGRILSEYGMTELFSQAYTTGELTFSCPPQMKVIGREISDPMQKGVLNETCALNIIDLANWRTISFIETEDQGKIYQNGQFEVLGRLDNSDVRGCNLMV